MSPPNPPTDAERRGQEAAELVAAAKQGDERAFARLVELYRPRIYALALHLTGRPSDADDITQDAFLQAFRRLSSFEGRSEFFTWLYRIAYNVYLNNRTRVRRFCELPEDYVAAAIAPENAMSAPRSDLRRDLSAAIETLPERYRAVVVLYYLEEVSYPEIAEILRVPLGTVKTHLHRAKKLLRERMNAR